MEEVHESDIYSEFVPIAQSRITSPIHFTSLVLRESSLHFLMQGYVHTLTKEYYVTTRCACISSLHSHFAIRTSCRLLCDFVEVFIYFVSKITNSYNYCIEVLIYFTTHIISKSLYTSSQRQQNSYNCIEVFIYFTTI